jgi:hypothetical protein
VRRKIATADGAVPEEVESAIRPASLLEPKRTERGSIERTDAQQTRTDTAPEALPADLKSSNPHLEIRSVTHYDRPVQHYERPVRTAAESDLRPEITQ